MDAWPAVDYVLPMRFASTIPLAATLLLTAPAAVCQDVSFNKQIQPILSEYCYHCHGPDSGTRKPKGEPLRLDRAEFAFAVRDDGKPAIVKGDAAASPVMQRIKTTDPDEVMPPPDSHKTLKPEEAALLEKWIAQGATYEEHWAFIPPKKPAPPANAGRTPIDKFVLQKIADAGLQPNPPEEKARLFRRLSYDLTGLPPSRDDLAAHMADTAPDAYEKAVDRMLQTDACAEHFARHWLDAARYGDTHGIHIDNFRSIWPYRDWVISAFKANMPFDRFTIEQMAGDLLPDPTIEQIVATGFNRCLPTTGEGGAIPEEYEAIYAKDRVDTMAAIWLGVTTTCASCHDHKFDPVTMKDFYSLTAFFRNTPMPALDGNNAEHPPVAFVPAMADRGRWRELPALIVSQQAKVDQRKKEAEGDFEFWLKTAGAAALPPAPTAVFHAPLDAANDPNSAAKGQVLAPTLPQVKSDSQFSFGATIRMEQPAQGAVLSRMDSALAYRGWDLFFQGGKPAVHIIDHWPDKGFKVVADQPLATGVWNHVMVTFDGRKKGIAAVTIHVNGKAVKTSPEVNSPGSDFTVEAPFRVGARSKGASELDSPVSGNVSVQNVRFLSGALTPEQVRGLMGRDVIRQFAEAPPEKRSPEQRNAVFALYLAEFDPKMPALQAELDSLKAEQEAIRSRGVKSLVMEEKKDEPYAHVLARGDYRNKTDRVTPATPAVLPQLPGNGRRSRLDLAKWLVDPQHPLTSRVTVNRVWGYFFGAGIVETPDDFGVMGARPTHPELLDFLAVSFVESGWDYRRLVRALVTTDTYRQSGRLTPEKLEKDPANKLLSRGPRHRLDAEQIRDGALAASGLLVPKIGGPPVKPYQPEGVWEAVAMKESNTRNYQQDKGENLWRRSLYTLWKRTAPPASMDILNAPTREVFCVRRERTNTPLQAFVTMNDPQFIEAARALAERALKHAASTEARLDFITTGLISRPFTDAERAASQKLLEKATAAYAADPTAAQALIHTGESKADPALSPAELAAWTLVASQVLNTDEALTK